MRKLFCIVVLCVVAGIASYGEEAAVIPQKNLRLSQDHRFGFADDEFIVKWGVGAEYGIKDWLNLQLFWDPYLRLAPDIGSGSLFLGVKPYIVGHGALLSTGEKFRVSAAVGLLIPPPDPHPDMLDQDQMLWGTALRLYVDYLTSRYFFISLFFENTFYPPQYQNDDLAAYRDWVRHYHDYTFELEGNFEIPLASGLVLKGGVPIRYFCAPYMNASDEYATSQYYLKIGAYFGLKFPDPAPPTEMYLKYNAHILGQNIKQIHEISIISKVTLPPGLLKLRSKGKTPKAGEGYTFTENENE